MNYKTTCISFVLHSALTLFLPKEAAALYLRASHHHMNFLRDSSASEKFRFVHISYDGGLIRWSANGEHGEGVFTVEQFSHGEWIEVADLKAHTAPIDNYYVKVSLIGELNEFRIRYEYKGEVVYSRSCLVKKTD